MIGKSENEARTIYERYDRELKDIFDGREQVTMFEMTKLVFNHVK